MEYDFDNESHCAADVDITELNPKPRKRGPRTRYSAEQLEILEAVFSETSYPSKIQVHNLSKQTKLPATVVRRWFNQKRFKSSVFGPRERIHLIPKTIETNDANNPHLKKYKTVLIRINSPSRSSNNPERNASNHVGFSDFSFPDSQNSASAKSMMDYGHNIQITDEATFEHEQESPYSFDGEFDSSFSTYSSTTSPDSNVGYFSKGSTPYASLNLRTINDEMRLSQNEGVNEKELGGCLQSEIQPSEIVNQSSESAQVKQCSVERTTDPMDVVQYQYVNMKDLHELGIDVNNFDDLPVLYTGTEHPSTSQNGWPEDYGSCSSVDLDTKKDENSPSNSSPLNTESSKAIEKIPANVIQRHVMESEVVVKPKTTESYNNMSDIPSDIVSSSTNVLSEPPQGSGKNIIILKRPSNSKNNYVSNPLLKKRMQRLLSRNGAYKSYLPTASTSSKIMFKSSKYSDAAVQNVPGFRPKIKVCTKAPVITKQQLRHKSNEAKPQTIKHDNPKQDTFASNSRNHFLTDVSDIADDVTSTSIDSFDLTKPVESSNTLSNAVVSPDSTEPKPKDSQGHCCCCHGLKPLQTQQVGPITQPLLTAMPLICFLPIQLPIASLSTLLQQGITAQDSSLSLGNSTTGSTG